MHSDIEYHIHTMEQEAYGAVLRAFKAQSDALTWEKEGLITELRKELRVSDDEHRELLTKVNADGLIHRIREWRKSGGSLGPTIIPQTIHDQLHSPTVSASRKKQKTAHSVPFGTASQGLHPQSMSATMQPSLSFKRSLSGIGGRRPQPGQQVLSSPAMPYQQPNQGPGALFTNELSQRTSDPLVGRKVMTRFTDDGNFSEAVITDYNPVEGRHALVYDINTPNESLEWVDLKQVHPENIRWIGDDPGISQRTGNSVQGLGGIPSNAGRGRGSSRDQSENEVRPSQNGVVKKVWDEFEILHTDTLIEKVEKVVGASHPDLLELQKAKKMLKEHEQTLLDVIAKLSDACDSGSDVEQQYLHRQSAGGEQGRNGGSNSAAGRVGNYDLARDHQTPLASNQVDDDDVII